MKLWGRRAKKDVDYRHRWPTQLTLVESHDSSQAPRFKRRKKFEALWLQRLKRTAHHEPGKSTHPYDTGVSEWGAGSGPTSRSASRTSTIEVPDDGKRWWELFTRRPQTASPLVRNFE
jgi:hypothetical protein